MNYKIFKKEQFKTSKWAGGLTTEMVIEPEDSNYEQRNFRYRISTAQINLEHSEFSKLPGISRKLMVLEGSVVLHHDGRYSKTLNKFDTDSFEGDWNTSSEGHCTDFNLMLSNNLKGEIKAHIINRDKICELMVPGSLSFIYIYLFSGKVGVGFDPIFVNLKEGELLEIFKPEPQHILIEGQLDSELVIVELTATF